VKLHPAGRQGSQTPTNRVATLRWRVATLVSRVGTLRWRVATLVSRVGTLRRRVATLVSRVGTLRWRVATLVSRVGTLRWRVATLADRRPPHSSLPPLPSPSAGSPTRAMNFDRYTPLHGSWYGGSSIPNSA